MGKTSSLINSLIRRELNFFEFCMIVKLESQFVSLGWWRQQLWWCSQLSLQCFDYQIQYQPFANSLDVDPIVSFFESCKMTFLGAMAYSKEYRIYLLGERNEMRHWPTNMAKFVNTNFKLIINWTRQTNKFNFYIDFRRCGYNFCMFITNKQIKFL